MKNGRDLKNGILLCGSGPSLAELDPPQTTREILTHWMRPRFAMIRGMDVEPVVIAAAQYLGLDYNAPGVKAAVTEKVKEIFGKLNREYHDELDDLEALSVRTISNAALRERFPDLDSPEDCPIDAKTPNHNPPPRRRFDRAQDRTRNAPR